MGTCSQPAAHMRLAGLTAAQVLRRAGHDSGGGQAGREQERARSVSSTGLRGARSRSGTEVRRHSRGWSFVSRQSADWAQREPTGSRGPRVGANHESGHSGRGVSVQALWNPAWPRARGVEVGEQGLRPSGLARREAGVKRPSRRPGRSRGGDARRHGRRGHCGGGPGGPGEPRDPGAPTAHVVPVTPVTLAHRKPGSPGSGGPEGEGARRPAA